MKTKQILKNNIPFGIFIELKRSPFTQEEDTKREIIPNEIIDNPIGINGNQTFNNTLLTNSTLVNDKKDRNIEFISKHEFILKSMLISEINESGIGNPSEDYFRNMINDDRISALNLINKIFLDYLSHDDREVNLLVSVLHMLSHFEYWKVYPIAQTIAMAAFNHKSSEVCEYAIKCFENWGHPDGAKILKAVNFHVKWLEDYANDIINELGEVQENVVISQKNIAG
jgi:hypothetical protein